MSAGGDALYIGLISGTSADAIDAALVRIGGKIELVECLAQPYPHALRAQLLELGQNQRPVSLEEFAQLDVAVGQQFAACANALLVKAKLKPEQIRAIGSHGQTLAHDVTGKLPYSLQIGDANVIAEQTGITTVADFRRRDVAAGGHGAPLVPAFHDAILRDSQEARAVLNLGGIANITLLPKSGVVSGFDTGPANALMDAWAARHQNTERDDDGEWARAGHCDVQLLKKLLGDPYFALAAPKSTGRDYFNLQWLEAFLKGSQLSPVDIQATLLQLSAQSVAQAIQLAQPNTQRLLVCGGGVHNSALMDALAVELKASKVESTASLGVDPDYVEAMAFAWLAAQTLDQKAGNLPSVTGSRGPRILGGIYSA